MKNKQTLSSLNSGKKNKELIERIEIEKTPFTAVKTENGWWLTMGKYRLVENNFESLDETKKFIDSNMWELIPIITNIIVEFNINNK